MLYYQRFHNYVVVFPFYSGYRGVTVTLKGESVGALLVSLEEGPSGWVFGVRFGRPSREYSF